MQLVAAFTAQDAQTQFEAIPVGFVGAVRDIKRIVPIPNACPGSIALGAPCKACSREPHYKNKGAEDKAIAESCATCRYCHLPGSPDLTVCRRRSPSGALAPVVPVLDSVGASAVPSHLLWPRTRHDYWCGEYEAKP